MHSDIASSCNVAKCNTIASQTEKSEPKKSNDRIKFGEQSKFFFVRFFSLLKITFCLLRFSDVFIRFAVEGVLFASADVGVREKERKK